MTAGHKFTDTRSPSILQMLQEDVQFKVPPFQRNYAWNEEKVEALWNDLVESWKILQKDPRAKRESEYLLGPIVLVKDSTKEGRLVVIDGQQRLATLTMMFCAARDLISEDVHAERADNPEQGFPPKFDRIEDLIQNNDMDDWKNWKLELNNTDREFFKQMQEYKAGSDPNLRRLRIKSGDANSVKLIKKSYKYLYNRMKDLLEADIDQYLAEAPNYPADDKSKNDSSDDGAKRRIRIKNHGNLLFFLNHVKTYNYLIQILVTDDSDAYQIFETLNERGQTLSKSDLIKNHVLNKVGNDNEMMQNLSKRWEDAFAKITATKQYDDDFILESYNSRLGDPSSLSERPDKRYHTSKKNLYKIIKPIVENAKDCEQFIRELEQDAAFLSRLNDSRQYLEVESKENIRAIKDLKAKFIRPVLLAAWRKWFDDSKPEDYTRLVEFMVKFFFKTRTVRQVHPGKIERMAHEAVEYINKGESLKFVIRALIHYDKHEEFLERFDGFMEGPQNDIARYVLQQITLEMGSSHDDVKPIDGLTLEHILPQDPTEWDEAEFFEGYGGERSMGELMKRLGNMTLLHRAINSAVQNSVFLKKRDLTDEEGNLVGYRGSKLEINKKTVANKEKWTAKIIMKREEKFTEQAKKIWDLTPYW